MATIKEVARRANVSIATVSYVLNDTGAVSATKRQAVLQAVADLGYQPSYRGRALQAQRSMTLGLVLPTLAPGSIDPSFGELLVGLTDGAAQGGYTLLLAAPTGDRPGLALQTQLHRSGRIDGAVIVEAQVGDPRIEAARRDQLPYICAGRADPDSPFVALDGVAGMMEAMAHLIVRGHDRIGLLQLPLEQMLADDLDAGYREALDEAGLPFEPTYVVEGGHSETEGYAATDELLSLPEPPTAIVAATAALAFGALHAIHDRGGRVGQDIALISFEDTPAAAHVAPPLTAVRQPLRAWGKALAEGVIAAIAGHAPEPVILQPQLIVRRSCGEGLRTEP